MCQKVSKLSTKTKVSTLPGMVYPLYPHYIKSSQLVLRMHFTKKNNENFNLKPIFFWFFGSGFKILYLVRKYFPHIWQLDSFYVIIQVEKLFHAIWTVVKLHIQPLQWDQSYDAGSSLIHCEALGRPARDSHSEENICTLPFMI